MNRDEILHILAAHRQDVSERFDVQSLALFGSVARDAAGSGSDVDVLVEFLQAPTFDQYMGLKLFLEDLLGAKVDLVTPKALKDRVRPYVEAEAIRVP